MRKIVKYGLYSIPLALVAIGLLAFITNGSQILATALYINNYYIVLLMLYPWFVERIYRITKYDLFQPLKLSFFNKWLVGYLIFVGVLVDAGLFFITDEAYKELAVLCLPSLFFTLTIFLFLKITQKFKN